MVGRNEGLPLNTPGTAFAEDGQPVTAVPFLDPYAEPVSADPLRTAGDATSALLYTLVDGARDCKAIGRRALTIAFLAGALPGVSTQAQLAALLGVSRARTSQILSDLTRRHR